MIPKLQCLYDKPSLHNSAPAKYLVLKILQLPCNESKPSSQVLKASPKEQQQFASSKQSTGLEVTSISLKPFHSVDIMKRPHHVPQPRTNCTKTGAPSWSKVLRTAIFANPPRHEHRTLKSLNPNTPCIYEIWGWFQGSM